MESLKYSGRVIIYGGKGALGRSCVSHFKLKGWWVGSIDFVENEQADVNVTVMPKETCQEQYMQVMSSVEEILSSNKIDAVICVAGGWAGGKTSSPDLIKNAELMWKQSVWSSLISTNIAARFLNAGGLLALTGAKAALGPTPDMIGYGMAKAAVHHLITSAAEPGSGMPNDSVTLGILPIILDTPANRHVMKGDYSTWTPLDFVAELLYSWATNSDRPKNGSLAQLITKKGITEVVLA